MLALADMTHSCRIAFTYYMQFFPKAQTLVAKHLHKAVQPPVIIHYAVAYLPLSPVFGGLTLLLLDDHLPLGKIANDHSPFSQCASDEMGGFVQTVLLFMVLLRQRGKSGSVSSSLAFAVTRYARGQLRKLDAWCAMARAVTRSLPVPNLAHQIK